MPTRKSLAAALGVLAVLGAGAAGWFLLGATPDAPKARKTPIVDPGPPIKAPVTGIPSVPAPAGTTGRNKDDDDDRDPDTDAPEGGASAEDLLFWARKGDWQEFERLLRISGSDDPRVTQFLLDALKDGEHRNWAAMLAKHLKDPAALAKFLEVAKSSADESTRSAALQASANIGGEGVFEAAADILRSAKPGGILFSSAAGALGTLGTPEATRALVDLLRGSLGTTRFPIMVEAIARVRNPEALAEIGRMANDEGQDPRFRETLIAALGQTKDPAVVPDLLKAAREGSTEEIRAAALTGLAMVGDHDAVQELVNLVRGDDEGKKLAAAMALQNVRNKAAGPLLEEALAGNLPEALRPYVVESLGYCGGKKSVEVLSKMLTERDEDNERLRVVTVRALGRIGDTSAGKAIVDALEGTPRSDAAFRREAFSALSTTATVEELPRIKRMFEEMTADKDPNWWILKGTVDALEAEKKARK
jgi:HEAT repeat protein